jgi:hypothetical protein
MSRRLRSSSVGTVGAVALIAVFASPLVAAQTAKAQTPPPPPPPPATATATTAQPKPPAKPAAPKPPTGQKPAAGKPGAGAPATGAAAGAPAGAAAQPDVLPPPPPPAQLVPPPPPPSAAASHDPSPVEIAHEIDQNAHIIELEKQMAALEMHRRQGVENDARLEWLKALKISGYLQPQLLWQWFDSNATPNLVNGQLPPGVDANSVIAKSDPLYGASAPITTNPDYFRLRRARLKLEYMPNDWSRFVFEIDPTPTGGPSGGVGTIARNVEAQGIVNWSDDIQTTFGMGIFKIPYSWEVLQSDADRPFIERSWWEQNCTPGEFDTGIKAYTTLLEKKMVFQAAVINGVTQGEKTFAILPDLNHGKDLVGRANYNFGIFDVGIGGYYGQGQEVSLTSLAFKQYPRGAFEAEAALHHKFAEIGETRVLGEFDYGVNLDRGVKYGANGLPGLPAVSNIQSGSVIDRKEIGYWIRAEQDLTKWFTVAARYDFYSPDTSASQSNGRDTVAAVFVIHFTSQLQSMTEYNHFVDNVHAVATATTPEGAPASKNGDVLSQVLQVRFP